jgi:hypothetical protein
MQTQTVKILEAALLADSTITPQARNRLLKLARNGDADGVENEHQPEPKIYSRAEAAKLVGDSTPRYIDQLAARGLLKKFVPPGNQRSIGITGESLRAFIAGA